MERKERVGRRTCPIPCTSDAVRINDTREFPKQTVHIWFVIRPYTLLPACTSNPVSLFINLLLVVELSSLAFAAAAGDKVWGTQTYSNPITNDHVLQCKQIYHLRRCFASKLSVCGQNATQGSYRHSTCD